MKVIKSVKELQIFIQTYKRQNPKEVIGLVPTMGALHKGHLSLIKASKTTCDLTIVSIFVNPTQFGVNEDFSKYPRKIEADLKICQSVEVDIVFMPEIEEMYPLKSSLQTTFNAPLSMASVLEGEARSGHFNGVLQIINKLFHLIQPHKAFFGKKDAQQLLIVQKMVEDLFFPIEIIPCEIVRSEEGLALSSRNVYLSLEGKRKALKISQSLKVAMQVIMQGERESLKIKNEALRVLEGLEVEYFAIVNRELESILTIQKDSTLILVVAKVEEVRLLDNLWF
ncbi:pantoate--beta-alanine ligase [Helicobacter apodemus]|uniref:Pantothenate synthetase n=1 Tax=Helicobacter apodemus TaxID=135569 RepID=A0A4V6I6Q7_9HELI|nr:pantoate--beta-alanine ligase [Helicobacter apodemus]TLE16522.1 pantoate--beta-alanine ligase [Helicobacter apodemus]